MKNPNPGRNQVPSNNTRKTSDSLTTQTHSIRNGLPVSTPRQSGPNRTRKNLASRLDFIKAAINNKKR